jgi:hypothetical protein
MVEFHKKCGRAGEIQNRDGIKKINRIELSQFS